MTPHLLKSNTPFESYSKNRIFGVLSKIKMFVPLFVGLYESHFGFRVFEPL